MCDGANRTHNTRAHANPQHQTMHGTVDTWTVVHHLWGAYFKGVLSLSWQTTLACATLWELFENTDAGIAFWAFLSIEFDGDTAAHAVTDILATMTGWCVSAL